MDEHETNGMALVTPKDIKTAEFRMTRFREGYDTDDVDRLLDKCATTIQVLTAKIAELVAGTGRTADGDK
jgi:DivIVA domain-containing protein